MNKFNLFFKGFYGCLVGTGDAHVKHVFYLEATDPTITPTTPITNGKLQVCDIHIYSNNFDWRMTQNNIPH